jgi:hypothetical protein
MSLLRRLLGSRESESTDGPITIRQLLSEEQASYRDTLLQLYADLRSRHGQIFPEPMIQLSSEGIPEGFRLYRPDAVFKQDEGIGFGEANSKDLARFAPVTEMWGTLQVTLHPFVWNAVEIRVQGTQISDAALLAWLNEWYDLGGTKHPDQDGLTGVIHNMTAPQRMEHDWSTSIDLGSSEINALVALVELLRAHGATKVEIGSFNYGATVAT